MKKQIMVLADCYDAYMAWCRMIEINPRKDAVWVHDLERFRGYRGHKWVMVGSRRQQGVKDQRLYDEWKYLSAYCEHEHIPQDLWYTLSPIYAIGLKN